MSLNPASSFRLCQVIPDAHDTPIQCLEYCEERDELATCGLGNKVHIWDISRPAAMKRKLSLDHSEGEVRGRQFMGCVVVKAGGGALRLPL